MPSSSDKKPGSGQRRSLTSRPAFAAGLITLAVFLWIGSALFSGDKGDAVETNTAAVLVDALPRVRIRDSQAAPRSVLVEIQGRTEAERKVIVRAETGGLVMEIPHEKGVVVARGDLLCRIDIRTRAAQEREVLASLTQRRMELEAAEQLAAQGHRSQVALASARATHEAAAARLDQIRLDIANTKITAPFDGILEDRHAEEGDLLSPGQPCATIIDLDPILVTAEATEEEVRHIKPGGHAYARLGGKRDIKGVVKYVAASADPRTRTFRVEVEVPNPDGLVAREGMTARLAIPSPPVPAHELPAAVLTLNDEGRIGVRIVEKGIVYFRPGEIVDSAPGKIWLAGPESFIRLIVVGQDFVSEGARVEALYENMAQTAAPGEDAPARRQP